MKSRFDVQLVHHPHQDSEVIAEHDLALLKEFEHVDRESPWPEYAEK
jgi:hypothetical protein